MIASTLTLVYILSLIVFINAQLPTSCDDCASGFGFRGTQKWCGCCALDCSNSKAACTANDGFCVTRCMEHGVCGTTTTVGQTTETPETETTEAASTAAPTSAGQQQTEAPPATTTGAASTATTEAATDLTTTEAAPLTTTEAPLTTTEAPLATTEAATEPATTEPLATTEASTAPPTTEAPSTMAPTTVPANQDCVYTEWSEFSACVQDCSEAMVGDTPAGTRTRSRFIMSPETGTGEACKNEDLTWTEECAQGAMEPCPCLPEDSDCNINFDRCCGESTCTDVYDGDFKCFVKGCASIGEVCETASDCCDRLSCNGDGQCEFFNTPLPTPETSPINQPVGTACETSAECEEPLVCRDVPGSGMVCAIYLGQMGDECGESKPCDQFLECNGLTCQQAKVEDVVVNNGTYIDQEDNDLRLGLGIALGLFCVCAIILLACFCSKGERDGSAA